MKPYQVAARISHLLVAVLLTAGCHSAGNSDEREPSPTRGPATLQVDNRGFADMTVYVIDGAQRLRLGIARGHSVTPLTIPDFLVRGGAASLRFFCDPIGGQGLPVSEQIMVEPGDTVELIIPST